MKVLVIDHVSKNFGGLQALREVSLEVELGERRAIIGPNGAGKTTLFHIISGILSPSSGAVYLLGENISLLPMHRRADLGISQTFQLTSLFPKLTVLENTILALGAFKKLKYVLHWPVKSYRHVCRQANKVLEEWQLWEKRDTRVSNLSYGDQRLMDIMLALGSYPKLLLLDEPISGLASAEIEAVTAKIKDLSREITVMLIEHNMNVALGLSDRVTVLNMGQEVTEGTPAEIRRDPQVKAIYLGTKRG